MPESPSNHRPESLVITSASYLVKVGSLAGAVALGLPESAGIQAAIGGVGD